MFHNRRDYHRIQDAPPPSGTGIWDTANKTANVSVSGGGLIVTATGTTVSGDGILTTNSHTLGKFYSEHTLTNHAAGGANTGIGVVDTLFTLGSIYMGGDIHSYGYYSIGSLYTNGAPAILAYALLTGSIAQVAIDAPNKLLWLGKDGLGYIGNGSTSGDPSAGTNGIPISSLTLPIFLCLDFESDESGSIWTSNFGGSAYAFTPPTGFNPW